MEDCSDIGVNRCLLGCVSSKLESCDTKTGITITHDIDGIKYPEEKTGGGGKKEEEAHPEGHAR